MNQMLKKETCLKSVQILRKRCPICFVKPKARNLKLLGYKSICMDCEFGFGLNYSDSGKKI